MSITTGKKARVRGGTRANIKQQTRHGNPSSYPVKYPNEQNAEARKKYRASKQD